eukprot:8917033-Pyramimonas_sp.AAC.1
MPCAIAGSSACGALRARHSSMFRQPGSAEKWSRIVGYHTRSYCVDSLASERYWAGQAVGCDAPAYSCFESLA